MKIEDNSAIDNIFIEPTNSGNPYPYKISRAISRKLEYLLTVEEMNKIMIDFWSDKHPQPCFMDMEKITELSELLVEEQKKKVKELK